MVAFFLTTGGHKVERYSVVRGAEAVNSNINQQRSLQITFVQGPAFDVHG
jgi:hypothetical protein